MTWTEKYQPIKADIIEAIRGMGVQSPQAADRREELFELWLEGVEYEAAESARQGIDRVREEAHIEAMDALVNMLTKRLDFMRAYSAPAGKVEGVATALGWALSHRDDLAELYRTKREKAEHGPE